MSLGAKNIKREYVNEENATAYWLAKWSGELMERNLLNAQDITAPEWMESQRNKKRVKNLIFHRHKTHLGYLVHPLASAERQFFLQRTLLCWIMRTVKVIYKTDLVWVWTFLLASTKSWTFWIRLWPHWHRCKQSRLCNFEQNLSCYTEVYMHLFSELEFYPRVCNIGILATGAAEAGEDGLFYQGNS